MEDIDQSLTPNVSTEEMSDNIKRRMFQSNNISSEELPDITT
jgi:hypothetical protein